MRKTREAAVRLSPTPPALRDSSITTGLSGAELWNSWITWARLFWLRVPSRRTKLKPCSLQRETGQMTEAALMSVQLGMHPFHFFSDQVQLIGWFLSKYMS